jgi:hypothetical protein
VELALLGVEPVAVAERALDEVGAPAVAAATSGTSAAARPVSACRSRTPSMRQSERSSAAPSGTRPRSSPRHTCPDRARAAAESTRR